MSVAVLPARCRVENVAQAAGDLVLARGDPAAPLSLLDRVEQLLRELGIAGVGEPCVDREREQLARAIREPDLLRRVRRVGQPGRIGLRDRAERDRELVQQHDGLLVAAVRGDHLRALGLREIGQPPGERVGLGLLCPRTHDHVAAEGLRAAELAHRLRREVIRGDVADHPGHVLATVGLGQRAQAPRRAHRRDPSPGRRRS